MPNLSLNSGNDSLDLILSGLSLEVSGASGSEAGSSVLISNSSSAGSSIGGTSGVSTSCARGRDGAGDLLRLGSL